MGSVRPPSRQLARGPATAWGRSAEERPTRRTYVARVDAPAAGRAALLVGADHGGDLGAREQRLPARVARVPVGEGAVGELERDGRRLAGAERGPWRTRAARAAGGRARSAAARRRAGRPRSPARSLVLVTSTSTVSVPSRAENVVRGERAAAPSSKRRVGEAVAEREADGQRARVVPAVAHQHALAVADLAVLAREVAVGRVVLEPQRAGSSAAGRRGRRRRAARRRARRPSPGRRTR